jgi:hypothetical protein
VLKNEPLVSARDGSVCGSIHIELRLALPLSELYALFLARHPEELNRIETAKHVTFSSRETSSKQAAVTASTELARLQNELEVGLSLLQLVELYLYYKGDHMSHSLLCCCYVVVTSTLQQEKVCFKGA